MFKLRVIAGPNRGSTYALSEGEVSIGRQSGNSIVLNSSRISKRHCTLVVSDGQVLVRDDGSANGTFVNGVLTQNKPMVPGDKVSVGEFVLELVKAQPRSVAPLAPIELMSQGQRNVIQLPVRSSSGGAPMYGVPIESVSADIGNAEAIPQDLAGKSSWYFEKHVMPFFYGLNLKSEWRSICTAIVGLFVLANLFISVEPLVASGRTSVVKEVGRRAQVIAKQISERNTAALAAGMEGKTEIGSLDREDGVRLAMLVDLENRIIAPASKSGQYLSSGSEATLAVKARDLFRKGRETGVLSEVNDSTIIAIEPVKVFVPQAGRNLVSAMAVVSMDTTLSTPTWGDLGLVYSQTFILTGLLGVLLFFVLYRITLKPLEVLNDDIDKVLKGNLSQVTREFKFRELGALWDVINSTLQRAQRSSGGGDGASSAEAAPQADEFVGPLQSLAAMGSLGLVVCGPKREIVFINALFEEISGIRGDSSLGQDIGSVARDQAFKALVQDMMDRVSLGGEGIREEFEFSGISYRITLLAFGNMSAGARCYALFASRIES